MENIVEKYKNGNELAKELLLDEIMEIYKNNITREEATLLLHKKHGEQDIF